MVVMVVTLQYSIVNGDNRCSTTTVGPTAYPSFPRTSTAVETEMIGSDFDHCVTTYRRHELYICKQDTTSLFLCYKVTQYNLIINI